MAARSVVCVVKNESEKHNLVLHEAALDHGVWSGGAQPPTRIPFGTDATWGSESDGFMTGTEGHATYWVGDTGAQLVIYWDNPFVGNNTFKQSLTAAASGAGVPDYVPFDPMHPDELRPRFTSSTEAPVTFEHGHDVTVTYRFAEAEAAAAPAPEPPPIAPSASDTRTVSAPVDTATAVRCPAGFRQVAFIGCTYFSSYGESKQLERQVKDLMAVLPEPSIDKWLMDDAEFEKRTPLLATVRDQLKALENADDPVQTTLYMKPPPRRVGTAPRTLMIRALAKMLGEVDSDLNPQADCLAMKRLVLSGHHCGAWTNDREDVIWGSTALGAEPQQILTLFSSSDGPHGVLQGLGKIFPKAFLQVEDLCFSACVTGYLTSPIPPAMFAMFKNLRTIWAYENESPNAQSASANPFWSTSNRALVEWEIASRNAGSEDAIDTASRALRVKFKGIRGIGKSIVWVQGTAREVND